MNFNNLTSASVATPLQSKYINDALNHKWSKKDGICPYCNISGQCIHWDGIGWTRDKIKFSYDLFNKEQ